LKILVSGGAGFIGAHYVGHVLAQGDQVVVVDNFSNSSGAAYLKSLAGPSLEVVRSDVSNREKVFSLVEDCDLVVNFAAWTHNDTALQVPEKFLESNVLGVFVLLEAARFHDKRFHHVSTDEIYGDTPLDADYEFNEGSPIKPSNPYSASKASADHIVNAWHRTFNVRTSISVSCNNFGPYQNLEKFIPRQISRILESQKPQLYGTGLNIREWMPVEINVRCIDAVAKSDHLGQTFNIGSGQRASNIEILTHLLEISDYPKGHIEFIDDRPGHDQRYALDSRQFHSKFPGVFEQFDMVSELARVFNWYRENRLLWH
jgi:dTDP-glucose 4,6-dehydratase